MYRLSIIGVVGIIAGVPASDIPPPRPVDVAALVGQLGSDSFLEREAATRRLSALPVDSPPPELLEATRSSDPEVRRRAGEAVKAIRANAEDRALGRERLFAKHGAIDLFVASTEAWDIPANDDRLWQAVLDVAMVLVRKLPKAQKTTPFDPGKYGWSPQSGRVPLTPARFWKIAPDPQLIRSREPYRVTRSMPGGIRAPEIVATAALYKNLVVASGLVRFDSNVNTSIILANGSLTAAHSLTHAIVVCDGDFEVAESLQSSIVIARGNIKVRQYAHWCTLIAGGRVSIMGEAPPKLRPANVIQEKQSRPLDFVTFFELSTVGVEVSVADRAVKVAAVEKGKPFDHAGVWVGDMITEVNGKKPNSAESLRRLLRDALAIGDATVKLNRRGKTETVKVSLPE